MVLCSALLCSAPPSPLLPPALLCSGMLGDAWGCLVGRENKVVLLVFLVWVDGRWWLVGGFGGLVFWIGWLWDGLKLAKNQSLGHSIF